MWGEAGWVSSQRVKIDRPPPPLEGRESTHRAIVTDLEVFELDISWIPRSPDCWKFSGSMYLEYVRVGQHARL